VQFVGEDDSRDTFDAGTEEAPDAGHAVPIDAHPDVLAHVLKHRVTLGERWRRGNDVGLAVAFDEIAAHGAQFLASGVGEFETVEE
jgi:hypothetical protein